MTASDGRSGESGTTGTSGRAAGNGASADAQRIDGVGVVVIGRNEGDRLKICIESLLSQGASPLVYVDSGSTDGSVEYAKSRGADVVDLDMSRPFTMGRARNAGFRRLLQIDPTLKWIQFVDGDCEIHAGWIATAKEFLECRVDVAAVAGQLRERYPERTVYNRLFDMECHVPAGETEWCGGPAMYRSSVLHAAGLFNEEMIAGEEPELCVRIRRRGMKIWRLAEPMGLHDAAMERFIQWWKRMTRGGHAYAEGFALQGLSPEHHNRRQLASCLLYGSVVPLACGSMVFAGLALPYPLSLLSRVGMATQLTAFAKVGVGAYRYRRGAGDNVEDSALYATFCIIGKLPEAIGAFKYATNRLRGRHTGLIEYRRS